MNSTRVYILAKELGVKDSDIINKCHSEGRRLIAIKNRMSPVSDDIADAIRTWFAKKPDKLDHPIYTIQFPFTVNKSFVNTSTHPITVPKKHNSVLQCHVLSDRHEITVCIAGDIMVRGYFYHGFAGWGSYYQVKIPRQEYNKIQKQFQVGQSIEVEVKISKSVIRVYLRGTE